MIWIEFRLKNTSRTFSWISVHTQMNSVDKSLVYIKARLLLTILIFGIKKVQMFLKVAYDYFPVTNSKEFGSTNRKCI